MQKLWCQGACQCLKFCQHWNHIQYNWIEPDFPETKTNGVFLFLTIQMVRFAV